MNDQDREYEEKKRCLQLTLFNDFINLNNIRFTSPYLQTLAGQSVRDVLVITINKNEFTRISKENNPTVLRKQFLKNNSSDELLLVSRDENGELQGSINLSYKNEVKIYYNNPEMQKEVVSKNLSKRNYVSKELLDSASL